MSNPLALALALVAALLVAHPHWPAHAPAARVLAVARVEVIVHACRAEGVTRRMCLATLAECFVESGLRARRRGASLCGCRPFATDDPTQARCAVRAVAAALAVCDTADEASTRYVDGRCRLPPVTPPAWRRHVAVHVGEASATRRALAP